MWWKPMLLGVFAVSTIITGGLVYGVRRWQGETEKLRAKLEAARLHIGPKTYSEDELVGLPAPVQRYFRAVLTAGQPIVAAVRVEHMGTFNMSEAGQQWKPFTSTQRVITLRPGFLWDARIALMPGLTARVHDAYIAGEGILHAALFGLFSLANMRGTPEMAQGELMRFFAEAAWYPTALLPSQGVQWTAVDDSSAKGTLQDGETVLTLLFRFDKDDLIASVRAESRGRTAGDSQVPTPWECWYSHYELHDGIRIPKSGEVAWILPNGPHPYWRGDITKISYQLAS